MTKRPCDCLDACGDDPALGKGIAKPCPRFAAWLRRPRLESADRLEATPTVDTLTFDRPIDAEQLRHVAAVLTGYCWRSP